MQHSEQPIRFFLGANTPNGFVSRFDQLADPAEGWRLYIIKGGPGCGKSTLMKKMAAAFAPYESRLELIHCSSDADSLDGLILGDHKIAFCDGTSPQANAPLPL